MTTLLLLLISLFFCEATSVIYNTLLDKATPVIYNTLPDKNGHREENNVGGPYAGSNVSMGGYIVKTPDGLSAGITFVADYNNTGNLSVNFILDNDPALSETCPNGQNGMRMDSVAGSCKKKVGINLLNPQCSLDVDDTICVNGVPISGLITPLAWYYNVSSFSPCNATSTQQYFTPSAVDSVPPLQRVDIVFVTLNGGAIALNLNNNSAGLGDCRGYGAVDFQTFRSAPNEVASGTFSFIAASVGAEVSGYSSASIASASLLVSSDGSAAIASAGGSVTGPGSVALACQFCSVNAESSVIIGRSNSNGVSGDKSLVVGFTNFNNATGSLVSGFNNNLYSSMQWSFVSGKDISSATNDTDPATGSMLIGNGLLTDIATPFPGNSTLGTKGIWIIGNYNDPNNVGITTSPRVFTIGGGDSVTRMNLFSVLENGDVHTKLGGTYVTGGADFQEYFEHIKPIRLPIGTTVKITENGLFRVAVKGDIPDGVVSRRGGVLGNSDSGHWVKKFVIDDDTGKIKLDKDGKLMVSKEFDPSRKYIPRSERPEWHTIGLVGQCEVLNDSVVDPRWIPMRHKSGAREGTKWYLIK